MLYLLMSKGSADLNVIAPKVAESPEKRETRLGKIMKLGNRAFMRFSIIKI
jgi:hypothetical protein